MSAPRPHRLSTEDDSNVVSRLQADLDQEEARRKRALRTALTVVGLSLVAAVAVLALLQSNASAAVRAPDYPVEDGVGPATEAAPKAPATVPSMVPEAVPEVPTPAQTAPSPRATQRYSIAIGQSGYEPSAIVASADEPIVVSVEQGEGCAAGFLIPALGVSEDNSVGPVTVDLGIVAAGSYQFSCEMGMVTGELIVR